MLKRNNYFYLFIFRISVTYLLYAFGFGHNWEWISNNDLYDCVAGISYKDEPIGVGVFFDINLLLTSANALEPYKDYPNKLKVHAITGGYLNSTAFQVSCAMTPYILNRENFWISTGNDGRHSSIHDLLILYVPSGKYCLAPEAVNASERHAFSIKLARPTNRITRYDFQIPGFGFIDQDHINRMDDLEVETFSHEEMVLVDCDEYVPEEWGRFICLKNLNNVTGVQSGSPLLQNGLIYGIGSFSIEMGNVNILVFTDVRDYVFNLHYCFRPGKEHFRWWSKYWPYEQKDNSNY